MQEPERCDDTILIYFIRSILFLLIRVVDNDGWLKVVIQRLVFFNFGDKSHTLFRFQ
jgi:hypothetical protein